MDQSNVENRNNGYCMPTTWNVYDEFEVRGTKACRSLPCVNTVK